MKKENHYRIKLWFDRLLSKSLWRQFFILAIVLACALGLSYLFLFCSGNDWEEICKVRDVNKWVLPIYLLIDSNALSTLYIGDTSHPAIHGWMLFASSLTFLFGAFIFHGIIIGIITSSIQRRVNNHKEGHIHYLRSGHYIIMGYDDMVSSIITNVFEEDKDAYILLLSAAETGGIQERLRETFDETQLRHIIVNYGHRTSPDYFRDIHLEAAKQIYIVGMRNQPSHDALNVECVDSICSYLEQSHISDHPKRLVCVFEDLDTYSAFKTSEIFGRVKQLGIEFFPYNYYTGWAQQIFVKHFHQDKKHPGETISYPAELCKETDTTALTLDDPRYVHIVFVGTTNFAVAFAIEAAHVLHFPNFSRDSRLKTRITFIDKNADKEKDEFIIRNRHFFEVQSYRYQDLSETMTDGQCVTVPPSYFTGDDADFLDIEFEFIKGDVFSREVQDIICQWAEEHNRRQYLSIYLAMSNQRTNFVMGMNMPDEVYDNEVPIFIRQDRSDNFVSNLRKADETIRTDAKKNTYFAVKDGALTSKVLGGRYANIYPFGMYETAYCADEKSFRRAKLINYLYCTMTPDNQFQSLATLDATPCEQIWEEADRHWNNLSVSLKWSNLYNAYSIGTKLAVLRSTRGLRRGDTSQDTSPLTEAETEIMARIEHNRWNVEKLLMGYRKAHRNEDKNASENAPFKDSLRRNKERFIHHDIRPYDMLDSIQELDKEFSRYIPWIISMTDKVRQD